MFIYLSEDQGTRIWALTGPGYGDWGFGYEDLGLGYEAWGLGYEDSGLGFEECGLGWGDLGQGYEEWGLRCEDLGWDTRICSGLGFDGFGARVRGFARGSTQGTPGETTPWGTRFLQLLDEKVVQGVEF